jgi:hypothetical protein
MHIGNKFNKMEREESHNIAKHQRIHRLIAIELIENKLDENKKSIELSFHSIIHIALLSPLVPPVRSSKTFQICAMNASSCDSKNVSWQLAY